jgi:hypothetical protein
MLAVAVHRPDSRELTDLQLLDLEMDLLWGKRAGPDLVIACARDGVRVSYGQRVPAELARVIVDEIGSANPVVNSSTPPPKVERWRVLLEDAPVRACGWRRALVRAT